MQPSFQAVGGLPGCWCGWSSEISYAFLFLFFSFKAITVIYSMEKFKGCWYSGIRLKNHGKIKQMPLKPIEYDFFLREGESGFVQGI
jgi:hypothetical protein